MALSMEEQRILAEIEQQFYREDPSFAQQVGQTTLYRHAARNVKWAALGLLSSLVFTLVCFRNLLLGLLGFLLMATCTLFLFQNLRKMGRAGYDQITHRVQSSGGVSFRDIFGRAGRRMRGRFGDGKADN